MLPSQWWLLLATTAAQPLLAPAGLAAQSFDNERRVVIEGYDGHAMEPFVSRDGRWLFFNNRNDPAAETDLFYAERIEDGVFRFRGRLEGANAPPPALDAVPSMDRDGNFFFVSTRAYGTTMSTLHRGSFEDGSIKNVILVAGNFSRLQPGWLTMDAEIGADGRELYYVDARFDGRGAPAEANIGLAIRDQGSYRVPQGAADILAAIRTPALEYAPSISADGLELYFTRLEDESPVILHSTRQEAEASFGPPEPVPGIAPGFVEGPSISGDGRTLYFHRLDGDTFRIYCVTR